MRIALFLSKPLTKETVSLLAFHSSYKVLFEKNKIITNRVYSVHRIINNPAQEKYYLKFLERYPFQATLENKATPIHFNYFYFKQRKYQQLSCRKRITPIIQTVED